MKRKLSLLIVLVFLLFSANAWAASVYPFTGALTGGGAGALDKKTGTEDKDAAIVMFNAEGTYGNAVFFFTLDVDGGAAESVPFVIDSGDAGDEDWELCDVHVLDLKVWGGNINTGDIDFTVGDATTNKITFTTDSTGDGEIVLPNDSIGAAEIATDAVTMDSIDADGTFTDLTGNWTTTGTLTGGTVAVTTLLDVNEEIDIDLDGADEEINITQSSETGTEDAPLIFIDDDRTGDTATELGRSNHRN